MEIQRNLYLEQLKVRKHNGLIKVITGVRRCGKSYLLLKIFRNDLIDAGVPEDHIIMVMLDDIAYDWLREPHVLYDYIKNQLKDSAQYYVLLDEIQYVPDFVDVLNGLLHIDNVDAYVTGSNSKFLSSDILTEFRGRGDEVRIYPLSFAEFFSVYDGSAEEAWDDYMVYGGMPQITIMKDEEQKSTYLIRLFQETYLKNIVERNQIKNKDDLDELVNILASSIGSLTNPTKLERTFKSIKHSTVTAKTIKAYIDALRDAFLVVGAQRYDIKGKRYINTPIKYYYVDTGLRNARLNFRQIEETHLMENIIFNELCIRGFSLMSG